MAVYLLDTDHLSYLQGRRPTVLARLARRRPTDHLVTSVIGMGELLRGIYVLADGRKRDQLFRLYHDVLTRMEGILPVTPQAAERFAEIDAMLRRKGRPIPVNDVWVAAVALSEDAVLVTADAHFSHVDHLATENWAA